MSSTQTYTIGKGFNNNKRIATWVTMHLLPSPMID